MYKSKVRDKALMDIKLNKFTFKFNTYSTGNIELIVFTESGYKCFYAGSLLLISTRNKFNIFVNKGIPKKLIKLFNEKLKEIE